jgi:exodeoxyribonuclease V alpha subunit
VVDQRREEIAAGLAEVERRVEEACRAAGPARREIAIIAVTKRQEPHRQVDRGDREGDGRHGDAHSADGPGRQALSELTGLPAMTVHRMLAAQRDPDPDILFDHTPAQADLIVVDEASMLDLQLAANLTAAIPAGSHLLLVGDSDQLPSIGAGNVLSDLLAVQTIPRVHLTHVFRQVEESGIIKAAHRIRAGELPELPGGGGFWSVQVDDRTAVAEEVARLATEAIPRKQNVAQDQVQVLCPMRRGAAGTIELGRMIQERVNPACEGVTEHWSGASVFRVGDRVMPTRNKLRQGRLQRRDRHGHRSPSGRSPSGDHHR